MKARNIIIASLLVVLAGGIVWYQLAQRGAAVEVGVGVAVKGDLRTTISTAGTTSSAQQISLNFSSSGKLKQLLVKEGDEVAAGQILAKLDTTDLIPQLKQAKASLSIARANLAKLRSGATAEEIAVAQVAVDSAALSLEAAKRKLSEAQTSTAQDVVTAQVAADNAKATVNFHLSEREETLKKWQDLVKKYEHPIYHIPNYTAAQEAEVDAAKAAADTALGVYLTAESSYKTALENLKNAQLKAQSAVQTAQDQVNTADGQYQTALAQLNLRKAAARPQDIRTAREQVKQAQASLEIAQNKINDAILEAPIPGKIISISAKEGEFVFTPSSSAFIVLADLNQTQVISNVDEVDISKVKLGQRVKVTFDAYPGKVAKGKVIEIGLFSTTTAAGGTAFPVKVSIASPKGMPLRVGMNVDVEIVVATHKNVIAVPVEAVIEKDGKTAVFVVKDSMAKLRLVEVGLANENLSEIKKGLKVGEKVVTKNASKLEGGERVSESR